MSLTEEVLNDAREWKPAALEGRRPRGRRRGLAAWLAGSPGLRRLRRLRRRFELRLRRRRLHVRAGVDPRRQFLGPDHLERRRARVAAHLAAELPEHPRGHVVAVVRDAVVLGVLHEDAVRERVVDGLVLATPVALVELLDERVHLETLREKLLKALGCVGGSGGFFTRAHAQKP